MISHKEFNVSKEIEFSISVTSFLMDQKLYFFVFQIQNLVIHVKPYYNVDI